MMIQLTQVWELDLHEVGPSARGTMARAYGSKRSGTIYLIADNEGEAIEVAKELFKLSGYEAPNIIRVAQTHLVRKAMRAIY